MIRTSRTAATLVLALLAAAAAFAQPAAPAPAQAPKIDLNTASEKELYKLPGVGRATVKKIVAGRPYSSVSDLSRAGISQAEIDRIAPLGTAGAPPAGSANRAAAPAPGQAAPAPGMVWVNTATRVFHREGDPYYGKTKHGKYMTEAEAIQQGYRPAKK